MELTNLHKGDDDQPTTDQAKRSHKWLEWEIAIQAELATNWNLEFGRETHE